jgi:hypothetical protein
MRPQSRKFRSAELRSSSPRSNRSASAAASFAAVSIGPRIPRQSESQVARPLAWAASFISWSVASFT